MLHSMTGFGKASCEYNNKKIVIEIKSLNSKQLDVQTRIAALYREKDIELRNAIAARLERGKIDLSLYIEDAGATAATRINQAVVENYKGQITDTCTALNMPVPANMMEVILRMPEVLKTETSVLACLMRHLPKSNLSAYKKVARYKICLSKKSIVLAICSPK